MFESNSKDNWNASVSNSSNTCLFACWGKLLKFVGLICSTNWSFIIVGALSTSLIGTSTGDIVSLGVVVFRLEGISGSFNSLLSDTKLTFGLSVFMSTIPNSSVMFAIWSVARVCSLDVCSNINWLSLSVPVRPPAGLIPRRFLEKTS